MSTFILRRVLQAVPVLFGISLLLFFMMHAIPGGPLAMYEHQPGMTKQLLAQLKANFGLNQPLWVQYWKWLAGALQGNFGYSYAYGEPALKMVLQRLPATLELMVSSYVIAVIISFVIGVISANKQYSFTDYTLTIFSYFGVAMPTFWLGLMVLVIFAADLHWFPAGGISSTSAGFSLADRVWHAVLPVSILAIYQIAHESRYVRSSMIDALHEDYVRTARAKGLKKRVVTWKHALRNALLPVTTVMIMDGAYLFGGALITESIFSWPGMGRLFAQAISQDDYPVIMCEISLLSVIIIIANILSDVLYAYMDPRVRYD
ncbi:ABC transporter permease [Alicyclobacillus mengziensis]|uniref:ABC transporter permease n=1 Tax=Alicyclobacillus mengziensis TaxID=2931921 RepID=A0A9X7Z683_9BACL|nr:ABC transporter permease [Alicyclobacillus mengziensis]QSO47102.1 ABC transporter permease [Alicyclobacillus mengziensis]